MTKQVLRVVPLGKVFPDEDQPRKNFNAARLNELMESIKEHGIMNPLVVEDMKNGNYLLVDGERRYRAATELKMKEVPVLVQEAGTAVDRMIKQFHIQEQHENWSPVEKAVAIGVLAKELKLSVKKMARLLSMPERTVNDYEGFYSLLERRTFEKSEIPLHYARYIRRLADRAKKMYEATYEKEFDEMKIRALEKKLMASLKSGEIKNPADFTRLKDAFTSNPDAIEKYLKGKDTVTQLYLDSDAKLAKHARNVVQLCNLVAFHAAQTVQLGGVELIAAEPNAKARIIQATNALNELLSKLD